MPHATTKEPRDKVQLGQMVLRASIAPESFNADAGTFEATFSTGARVLRQPWVGDAFMEELDVSEGAMRSARMKAGGPLLLWHDRYSYESLAGVIEDAWVATPGTNGQGDARLRARLSARPEMAGVRADVASGILRSLSVGYRVYRYLDVTTANDPMTVLRAVDWEPMEVSLCSVPEDAQSTIRARAATADLHEATIEPVRTTASGEGTMPPKETLNDPAAAAPDTTRGLPVPAGSVIATPPPPPPPAPAVDAARAAPPPDAGDQVRAAERTRTADIMRAATAAGASTAVALEMVERGITAEQARTELRAKFTAGGGPEIHNQISVGRDEHQLLRDCASDALLTRHDPVKHPMTERGRKFAGSSLLDLARSCLELVGESTSGSKMDIARRALATTDFPAILENIATKTLRMQYEAIPQAWRGTFARVTTVPDFKPVSRTMLSAAPVLLKVEEGGEIQYGGMSDSKQVINLATYARKLVITRRAIVNDDLGSFTRIPQLMAAAARRLEDALVYGTLTSNPVMQDGLTLFHASHGNLGVKTLTNDGLTEFRTKLRNQLGLAGENLNLAPGYIMIPASLETSGKQLLRSEWVPTQPAFANTFRDMNPPIVHPLLDASSTIAWYGSATVDQIDMIEIAFLEGEAGPVMEEARDPNIDGFAWNVREDVTAAAIDYRGLFKSAGTTP